MKRLALTALLAAVPPVAGAVEGGTSRQEVPAPNASAEQLDGYLRVGQDGGSLAALVAHLHARVSGGRGVPGLDAALTAADRKFTSQGGADDVQKALLFNGREAREGLSQAYDILNDYSQKLGLAWKLGKEGDRRLMAVFARQADAAQRIKAASGEAGRYASGMETAPPSSQGGDPQAGQLSAIESQERDLADLTEKIRLAKELMTELEGRLAGIDALQSRIEVHAEKAGLLDHGSGQFLSASMTGQGTAAPAGTSKEILTDAVTTLRSAVGLAQRTRSVMAGLVERTVMGAERGTAAERALAAAKEEAARGLETAERNHQRFTPSTSEEEAKTYKAETAAAAGKAAAAACPACAQAAAAKAAASTCPCAKNKAEAAMGDTGKLKSLEKLEQLALRTAVQDGAAPTGSPAGRHVDVSRMTGLLGNSSFDGRTR